MPSLKCVTNLPYTTNLPRDVSQQTWAILAPTIDEDTLDDIGTLLGGFFNTTVLSTGDFVGQYISPVVSRPMCWVDIYDVSTLPSGPPIFSKAIIIGSAATTTSLPLEVSLVQSFQGDKITGGNQARRRGRNFIGPLNTSAMEMSAGMPRPSQDFMNTLTGAAQNLEFQLRDQDLGQWCVWSRSTSLFVPITNGWVNDEWDTQRRREGEETDRKLWFAL